MSLVCRYYRGALGALLVYDITAKESFQNVETWLRELQTNSKREIVLHCVGNKTDLPEARQVTEDDIKALKAKLKIPVIECSAKSGDNVDEAMPRDAPSQVWVLPSRINQHRHHRARRGRLPAREQ